MGVHTIYRDGVGALLQQQADYGGQIEPCGHTEWYYAIHRVVRRVQSQQGDFRIV
jgi:hypothetical protein